MSDTEFDMSDTEFDMSDTKHDQHGNEYRIADVREGECLVYRKIVNEDGWKYDGPLCILRESILFDDPPQQKGDGEVAEAKAALADLNEQIEAARGALTATERAAAERMARLKQHPALKHLDDFLAGRITHFVEYEYHWTPPKILTWDDAKTHQGRIKLLTLFGDSKGDWTWQQNRYCDGTGYIRTVIPCVSRDEALAEVVKIFAAHEVDSMNPKHSTTPSRQWVEQAEKYGLSMTDGYMRALERLESSARQTKVAKLRSEIETLEEDVGKQNREGKRCS